VRIVNIGIRLWKLEDAEFLANALNNKKIQDNLRDGLPFPYAVSDAEAFISAMLAANPNETYARAITVDGIAAGSIGVFRKDNVHRLTAEMGYFVAEEYWGKGVMTEAVKLMCRYIFEKTDIVRIFADPYAFNLASCRVLEKAGFEYEGTLRKNAVKNGRVVDMKMYSIVKEGD
jgi:RimJ/RimL family protein N-acetyltransferase